MRISSTGNIPSNSLLGQMSSIQNRKSNLIFVYPILFDQSLIKNWENLVRDFQSAQFISQIKISNVLNITQAAVHGYGGDKTSDYINPAEILNSSLTSTYKYDSAYQSAINNLETKKFNTAQQQASRISNTEYAYKINEFKSFIKQQLLTDPLYANLRPSFSLITVENNLLDIPMIIGTKTYKIQSSPMYWILFALLTNNLKFRQLNTVTNIIRQIPRNNFLELSQNINSISRLSAKTEPSNLDNAYSSLLRDTETNVKKSIDTFEKVTTTLDAFEADIGFSTSISASSAIFSNVISNDSQIELNEVRTKSTALINQILISSVLPIIQTTNNLLVNTNFELNFNRRYTRLFNELNKIFSSNIQTLIDYFSIRLTNISSQDDIIRLIVGNCNSLKNLNSVRDLEDLNRLRIKYSDIQGIMRTHNASNAPIVNFAEDLTNISSKLTTQIQTISNILSSLTNGDVNGFMSRLFNEIHENVKFYFTEVETFSVPNPAGGPPTVHTTSIYNFNDNRITNIFGHLFTGIQKNELNTFMLNIINSISNIIAFIFLFSSMSYICEFLNIIKSKVEIKSKDVIEFPNFTLVIPIEYVSTLYYTLAAKNVSDYIKNINNETNKTFKLTESNINRIIDAIIVRFEVPNIIIIDDSKNEIYYRWGFSKRTIKINKSTMINYIKSQNNIMTAF